jgi:hypothetical protein
MPLKTMALVPEGVLECSAAVFDTMVPNMPIGFKYFQCPGPFVQYRNVPGAKGRFLGVWSVLMQV